jgi:superfamily I DNA and/or RNA helicase
MHPEISALVRNSVYGGRAMKDPPDMSDQRDWMYSRYPNRAVLVGIRTGAAAKGKSSQEEVQRAEAQATANEVIAFIKWADLPENRSIERSIAMISFYREGVRALNQEMKKLFGSHFDYGSGTAGIDGQIKVRVGTVDKFQGREADLVILNVGNNYLTAHLKSINRVNVALTRARYQLVIVGEVSALMRGQEGILLADLARTLPRFEVLRG